MKTAPFFCADWVGAHSCNYVLLLMLKKKQKEKKKITKETRKERKT